MAEKKYVVLEDQKYTGKHKVYLAGQTFNESEIFGSAEKAIQDKKIEVATGKVATKKASK